MTEPAKKVCIQKIEMIDPSDPKYELGSTFRIILSDGSELTGVQQVAPVPVSASTFSHLVLRVWAAPDAWPKGVISSGVA